MVRAKGKTEFMTGQEIEPQQPCHGDDQVGPPTEYGENEYACMKGAAL
jgi:hypothetical protein